MLWIPDEHRILVFGKDRDPAVIPESAATALIPKDLDAFGKWAQGCMDEKGKK